MGAGMMCVGENFCDANTEVSDILLVLTKADKDKRGKLIVSKRDIMREWGRIEGKKWRYHRQTI
jgi:hypothetical protein